MGWCTVTNTIDGCSYLYLQMTDREARKVKTRRRYLGRVEGASRAARPRPPADRPSSVKQAEHG